MKRTYCVQKAIPKFPEACEANLTSLPLPFVQPFAQRATSETCDRPARTKMMGLVNSRTAWFAAATNSTAVRLRPSSLLSSIVFVLILSASSVIGSAQTPQSKPSPSPDPGNPQKTSSTSDDVPPLGPIEEEMRAKRAIRLAEKEYKDNLNRAREAAQISTQLSDSYKRNGSLTREDNKRLDRLEKLAKRIRSEAGGSSEDVSPGEPPRELEATLARLAELSEFLRKSVESTPRQVVSASVIEQANVILELIKFTRNFSH